MIAAAQAQIASAAIYRRHSTTPLCSSLSDFTDLNGTKLCDFCDSCACVNSSTWDPQKISRAALSGLPQLRSCSCLSHVASIHNFLPKHYLWYMSKTLFQTQTRIYSTTRAIATQLYS